MSLCNWPVSGRRPCSRSAAVHFFADLVLCWQHQEVFLNALAGAVRAPEDRYDEQVQDVALSAVAEAANSEKQRREVARRAASLVYFVERDGFVKIGYSSNLDRRIKEINAGDCAIPGMTISPVALLATIENAGEETERWMHRRFDHLWVGGEWFLLDDELRSFISGLKGCRAPALAARGAA